MSGGISAIGNIGLGSTGAYSSYDPTLMSMMGGYGTMNPAMMNMMSPMMSGYTGMSGMYGGSFYEQQMQMMKYYMQMQEEMEKYKLQHATNMHSLTQQASVTNLSEHDKAFFLKAMEDGYVQQGIREIYDGIRTGNMDYVTQKFYELKQGILNKYGAKLEATTGGRNSKENLNNYIRLLYSEIGAGYNGGIKPDMIHDVKTYGETPLQHGWNKTFLGNSGHNELNAEEALNQMFGTAINDAGSKAKAEKIGAIGAHIGEGLAAGAVGTGVGLGLATLGQLIAPKSWAKAFKFKPWGLALGAATAIGDAIWQSGRA